MGSNNSSSMDDSDSIRSEDGSDQETDLATILQYLIRSGQVQIISSNYEEDLYLGPRIPKIKHKPNTSILDKTEFALETKQASGCQISGKRKRIGNSVSSMLLNRERGMFPYTKFSLRDQCHVSNRYLPNEMTVLSRYGCKAFCGNYSPDGNYFISACQDRHIRVFDTRNGVFKLINTVQARDVGWSVIDVAFSPDCSCFVYSSWSTALHLCTVNGDSDNQEALSLSPTERRFCIFSVAFSSDSKDILGGANDGYLYVYDRERGRRSLRIHAHDYDVNTVAFADGTSQILYSGGDDGLAKVWDRRTLSEANPKPVGFLAGHMDGITFIDSRGDGRHLISNSKDQSIKLWDIRRFSAFQARTNTLKAVHDQTWDYRWQAVPRKLYNPKQKLDGDTSIMTYRGHSVLKTLVRCRFSPAATTGQRYIYTGCGVGRVVIYDVLTGRVKRDLTRHHACVRDVSWHPYRCELVSSSWDGVVGKWTYQGAGDNGWNDGKDEDASAANGDDIFEDDELPRFPRRSRRIAQRREREVQRREEEREASSTQEGGNR